MRDNHDNGLKKHLWSGILTIVLFLVGQSFAGVWWASSIETRVDHAEGGLKLCEQRVHELEVRPKTDH